MSGALRCRQADGKKPDLRCIVITICEIGQERKLFAERFQGRACALSNEQAAPLREKLPIMSFQTHAVGVVADEKVGVYHSQDRMNSINEETPQSPSSGPRRGGAASQRAGRWSGDAARRGRGLSPSIVQGDEPGQFARGGAMKRGSRTAREGPSALVCPRR